MLFIEKASSLYAIYLIFIIANVIMVPLGILMIRAASYVLRAPRSAVMPVILLCCTVGSFAIAGNNPFAVVLVAVFGVLGYAMEANGFPVAALVLGMVMGPMVEHNLVTSLIKSDGSPLPFFERPAAAVLAMMTIAALVWPLLLPLWRSTLGRHHRREPSRGPSDPSL